MSSRGLGRGLEGLGLVRIYYGCQGNWKGHIRLKKLWMHSEVLQKSERLVVIRKTRMECIGMVRQQVA